MKLVIILITFTADNMVVYCNCSYDKSIEYNNIDTFIEHIL